MNEARSILTNLVAAILVASAPTAALAAERALDAGELAKTMTGASLTGTTTRGDKFVSEYAKGGAFSVRVPARNWSDSGKWWIEGDQVCSERTQRAKTCYHIVHVDGDQYRIDYGGGQGDTTVTLAR